MSETSPAAAGCPVDHAARRDPHGCPVSAGAAAFDPFGDGYQQNPPEYLRWARAQEPVFWAPRIGYWVVTRYDDIKAVFRDHESFDASVALERMTPVEPRVLDILADYDYGMQRTMVNEVEPVHMARRRALIEPFTPQALMALEPMVRRVARQYVDRFVDDGRADLVEKMFWEAPLTVGLHFLGVEEDDMALLRQYSVAHTVNIWGRPTPEEQIAVAHAVGNFWQLSGRIVEKMRATPDGPGWMRYTIRKQQEHPDVVTDSYIHSMMMAIIVAAHETTSLGITNAVRLLLENRAIWDELCADPGLIPGAVEECLRHNGSVAAWRRYATRDAEIGGVRIPQGSRVLVVLASGNHDERHFSDPDAIDVRRDNASEHLTFGYGSHQCMGKNLARLELQIYLEELTRRLPHLRLLPQRFDYVPNTSFRGPKQLWVEWDPALNPERAQPALLAQAQPVRLGESSRQTVTRPVVVERITRLTDDTLLLRLVAANGQPLPGWAPGAHVDVECGGAALSRQYSLCGDPADSQAYEIAVLRDPDSRGGSAWIHEQLKVGERLRLRGPRNHFRFDETGGRAIFIAGGIGITPIAAMARRARQRGMDYQIHYSGRGRARMALLAELQAEHGERLVVHASDEGRRVDLPALLAAPRADTRIYACGPQRMLDALQSCTAHWPESALCVEHFQTEPPTLDPAREHAFEVELRDSGITLRVRADQTILSALQGANIDVQCDCTEGLCGSCETRVLGGAIDHRDVVLTRAERERQDRMMVCCSRAQGERLVLEL